MRARIIILSAVASALLLIAGPASALETKPTNPPTDDPSGTVVSAPQPPYIESVRYAGGNGDQTPDPGERLQVFFSLRNPTDQTLKDVTGTLTVKGDDVTVIDGSAAWPDIAAGAIEEATAPFLIQISDSAARATPCSGGLEVAPAPGTVTPVASDVAISTDGVTSSGSGSAPAASTSAEPGSVGSTDPGVVEPAPPATATPVPIEPAPDAPVPFDASLAVHTSGSSFDAGFGSGVACPLALGAPDATNTEGTAAPQKAPEVKAVAADSLRTSARSSSVPFVLAVLIAAAGALVARYRFTA